MVTRKPFLLLSAPSPPQKLSPTKPSPARPLPKSLGNAPAGGKGKKQSPATRTQSTLSLFESSDERALWPAEAKMAFPTLRFQTSGLARAKQVKAGLSR